MKTLIRKSTIILSLCLAIVSTTVFVSCQRLASRQSFTTISSVVKAVDIAEREYFDGILQGRIKTNNLPEIQASYDAFQEASRLAVAAALNDTNALSSFELSAAASRFILNIQTATRSK